MLEAIADSGSDCRLFLSAVFAPADTTSGDAMPCSGKTIANIRDDIAVPILAGNLAIQHFFKIRFHSICDAHFIALLVTIYYQLLKNRTAQTNISDG